MRLNIQKTKEAAKIPQYMSEQAAGADVFACLEHDVVISPGETKLIPLGFKMELPPGFAAFLLPRSGLGVKSGIVLGNLVGVCDADYRGEYMAALWYRQDGQAFKVSDGDRIAQMVIMPVVHAHFDLVDELGTTDRGTGGFGSSGTK